MRPFALALALTLVCAGPVHAAALLDWTYTADNMPTDDGFDIVFGQGWQDAGNVFLEGGGILHLTDPLFTPGSAALYHRAFTSQTDDVYAVEIDQQLISGYANRIFLDDGTNSVSATMTETHLSVAGVGTVPLATTDGFHTYRLELSNGQYSVSVDNALLLSGAAQTTAFGSALVDFGLSASNGVAEYRVDEIRAYSGTVPEPASGVILLCLSLGGLALRRSRSVS